MLTDDALDREILAYRLGLDFPAEFDVRRSLLQVFVDPQTRRYVKTVHPRGDELSGNPAANESLHRYYRAAILSAADLWRAKYGEDMPESAEGRWADSSPANAIPYDGRTRLSDAQWGIVERLAEYFTLTKLWFLVEGLGWKPGEPVPEEDEKWIAVWAEERDCVGYLHSFRVILGMPGTPYFRDRHRVPPAVRYLAEKCKPAAETVA